MTADELSADNLIEVTPNPASNLLNLNLELVEMSNKFSVTILDMAGKTHFRQRYERVQNERMQFDLSSYGTGNYIMFISTEHGTAVRKFAVQK